MLDLHNGTYLQKISMWPARLSSVACGRFSKQSVFGVHKNTFIVGLQRKNSFVEVWLYSAKISLFLYLIKLFTSSKQKNIFPSLYICFYLSHTKNIYSKILYIYISYSKKLH